MSYQLLQSSIWNYLNGWKKRKIIENGFMKYNGGCEYKGLNIKTWQEEENLGNEQVLLFEKVQLQSMVKVKKIPLVKWLKIMYYGKILHL